jgi:L-lactate dehydrogenase complex protein LldG
MDNKASRSKILEKLRQAQQPFTDIAPITERRHMVPIGDMSREALVNRFVAAAEALSCTVRCVESEEAAIQDILGKLEGDGSVLAWEWEQIPLPQLKDAMEKSGCKIAAYNDSSVRVGITGAEAALAATGSLVMGTGAGKYRQTSLLPSLHIAVIKVDQVVADFETWMAMQRVNNLEIFRGQSNIVLISGPSRTADIAFELILGMHGPHAVHVVIVDA